MHCLLINVGHTIYCYNSVPSWLGKQIGSKQNKHVAKYAKNSEYLKINEI